MVRLFKSPFGDPGLSLDAFVVMSKGENALRHLTRCTRNSHYAGDPEVKRQLSNRLFVYHFYPFSDDYGVREQHISLFCELYRVGGITESEFTKRGPAVVVDDVVSSGRTLQGVVQFLLYLGYGYDEMFVYAQRCFLPKEGDEGRDSLWPYRFVHITAYADVLKDIPKGANI